MMNKMELVVLAKSRYNFKNDNDGSTVKGAKIFVEGYVEDNQDKEGMFPTEFAIDYDKYVLFPEVPAKYEVSMIMKPGSKGQFTINEIKLIGSAGIATNIDKVK